MRKFVKRIAFVLVFTMLFSSVLASCDKDKDDGEKDPNAWSLGTEGRSAVPDNIPEDTDLDGYTFNILCRQGDGQRYYEYTGDISEENNPVYRKVYERNLRVENRLNCNFKWIETNSPSDAKEMLNHINADDYYDFFNTSNSWIVPQQINHKLIDFNDSEFPEYHQEWWWSDVMTEMSYDGRTINFLVGDMNLMNFMKMSAFYFNFDLVNERLQMQPQDFYDMVNTNTWTIAKVDELSSRAYRDLNGNGDEDTGDGFAFPWTGFEVHYQFYMSTKVATEFYTRETNGLITLNMIGNNDIYDTITAVRHLIRENQGVRDYSAQPQGSFDGLIVREFASGEYVFLAQRLSAACSWDMRQMQSLYGILPYPVLNEGDDYVSEIQNSSTCMFATDVCEKNLEIIGIALEALCSEAYRYTYDAFFNMALKNKYTNDIESAKMVDIIYKSAHKSFIGEYYFTGIIGALDQAIKGEQNVMTLLEKYTGAEQQLNNYIAETKAMVTGE